MILGELNYVRQRRIVFSIHIEVIRRLKRGMLICELYSLYLVFSTCVEMILGELNYVRQRRIVFSIHIEVIRRLKRGMLICELYSLYL